MSAKAYRVRMPDGGQHTVEADSTAANQWTGFATINGAYVETEDTYATATQAIMGVMKKAGLMKFSSMQEVL
jgi:hypothetical protein